jgi:hypothetical protein
MAEIVLLMANIDRGMANIALKAMAETIPAKSEFKTSGL